MAFERAEIDSPDRCQGTSKLGQCTFKAIKGSKFCNMHGGAIVANREEAAAMRNLQLTQFRTRMVQLGNSPQLMSLRDEIGILRLTLETVINSCTGPADLIINVPQISVLVGNIERTVKSCHTIEEKTGHLLSRDQLTQFAAKVVDIILRYITDDDIRREVAAEVEVAVREVANGPTT